MNQLLGQARSLFIFDMDTVMRLKADETIGDINNRKTKTPLSMWKGIGHKYPGFEGSSVNSMS